MHFVSANDGSSDCMELITKDLEGAGILQNKSGAPFHQLQVILETNFMNFGMVVEGVL